MKINTDEKVKELVSKVKAYIADEDGWKLVKKSVSNHDILSTVLLLVCLWLQIFISEEPLLKTA